MTVFQDVLLEKKEHVALLTLNRPKSMNAITREMFGGLREAAEHIRHDSEIRAVIIAGAGDRAFCAGLDLKKSLEPGGTILDKWDVRTVFEALENCRDSLTMYEELPVPVIAAIHGYCLGGGIEIALVCDIRLASEDAVFAMPEARLGIVPDVGGSARLPRVIGAGKAKELIYTGRRIDAREALRIGLVQHVYPKGELMAEAWKMAGEIAEVTPSVAHGVKLVVNYSLSLSLHDALSFETATSMHATKINLPPVPDSKK